MNATEAFAANGGYAIMLSGVLWEQTTVNTDGSYDVQIYLAAPSRAWPMRRMTGLYGGGFLT